MDLLESDTSRLNFEAYINQLISVIGHADRAEPLHDYCTWLLLPGERKSVEPMAALTAPARTAPKHQSLLHFVANAPWSDEAVLTKIRQMVLPKIEALGPIEAVIVDDTGFHKKGKHSVGVRGNTAASWASRTIVRPWCRCPWPTTMPACPSPIGSICPRPGPTMRSGGQKPKCRRTSSSRPNRVSRWTSCAPPRPPAFRSAPCWPMPATATTASSATG